VKEILENVLLAIRKLSQGFFAYIILGVLQLRNVLSLLIIGSSETLEDKWPCLTALRLRDAPLTETCSDTVAQIPADLQPASGNTLNKD